MDSNQRYLIVDDDSDDIDFFCEALQEIHTNAICYIAKNGEEALELLRKKTDALPDFIFLDLNMPRMDGKSCLAELKKDAKLKDIPVVIYSTSSHQKDIEETLSLGADHFLTKATSFRKVCEDIVEAVRTVLQNRRLRVL